MYSYDTTSFFLLQLPRLRNLRISGSGDSDDIFNGLTIHALRAVELFNHDDLPGWANLHRMNFSNLLWRSSCVLEKLVWDMIPIRLSDLLQCLANVQDLKELQILDAHDIFQLLRYLTPNEWGAYLCPKLQVIQLPLLAIRDKEDLIRFVQSRRSIVSGLNHITRLDCIRFTDGMRADLLDLDLDEAQEDGLDVFLST